MHLVYAEILGSLVIFALLLFASIFPYIFVRYGIRKRAKELSKPRSPSRGAYARFFFRRNLIWALGRLPWFSLCNCLAAGIFMSTCFVGLVPHVRQHVDLYERLMEANTTLKKESEKIHHSNGGHARKVPWTELLLVSGLLFVMILEELMRLLKICCSKNHHSEHTAENSKKTTVRRDSLLALQKFSSKDQYDAVETVEDQPLMIDCLEGPALKANSLLYTAPGQKRIFAFFIQTRAVGFFSPESVDASHLCHKHEDVTNLFTGNHNHSITWRSVALLFSLGLHGVFEGVALGLQDTPQQFWRLLSGVLTHEILCAAAFGINLASCRTRFASALSLAAVLAAMVPFGMSCGTILRSNFPGGATDPSSLLMRVILEGLAAGTFIYVTFFDLLREELVIPKGDDVVFLKLLKILFVCAGFFLFFLITVAL